jgi:hypothetical protein
MSDEKEFKKLIAAYKSVFATENGKIVLRDLAKFCKADTDIFDPDSARKTDFNLGKNAVYNRIMDDIDRDLERIEPIDAISEQETDR